MVGFSSLSGRGTFLNLLQQYFLFRPLPPLPAAVSNCVGKTEEGGQADLSAALLCKKGK